MRDRPLGFDQRPDGQFVPAIGGGGDNAGGAGLMQEVDSARAKLPLGLRLGLGFLQWFDDLLHVCRVVHAFLPRLRSGP